MRLPSEMAAKSSERRKLAATAVCCLVGMTGWIAGAVLIPDAMIAHLAVIFGAALVAVAIAGNAVAFRRRVAYENIYFRSRGVPEPLSARVAHESS